MLRAAAMSRLLLAFGLVSWMLVMGCSSEGDSKPTELGLVDPATDPYGKSYSAWAVDWVDWVHTSVPPSCMPMNDTTGEHCAVGQAEGAPVFFLAGTYGGVAVRDRCVAPASAALFFPILNTWGDNAGVPTDQLLSDAEMKSYVEGKVQQIDVESLTLEVDGRPVEGLERGLVPATPYLLDLPPGASSYTCTGNPDVAGEFSGYVGGYWAMLAPLGPGKHVVHFTGRVNPSAFEEAVTLDVRYELSLE